MMVSQGGIFMNNQQLVKKCQENIWLKRGGVMFEDDPFAEFDYEYSFHRCSSLEELKNKFLQGNWSIRWDSSFVKIYILIHG